MRLVVALLVPATKVGAIEWVVGDRAAAKIDLFLSEIADESRNPLAFVHVGLNLILARMMGKLRRGTFPEGHETSRRDESVGMADFRGDSQG